VPRLRRSCLNQALMFGAFSTAWTTVALLLTGPAYHLGTQAVWLLVLVGAGSVLAAGSGRGGQRAGHPGGWTTDRSERPGPS